jgi:diguanylate cyclase (GGDEF)-like protein
MNNTTIRKYEEFIVENRVKVNGYLNRVLWFFVITGPAIAAGVKGGIFRDITYVTCFSISLVVVLLSGMHLFLLKKMPNSRATSIFALTALNALIVYMSYSHVSIHLTWFLVPMLSLLFCDRFIFFYALILNYILMFATTWITAPYYAAFRPDYPSAFAYFTDVIGGFTIETCIMGASAYMIGKLTVDYYKELFRQYTVIMEQEVQMQEEIDLLDSMVEIYENVNLISFVDNTEMSLRDPQQNKVGIDIATQTHTVMNQRIMKRVVPDQQEAFKTFTNIQTLRSRLANKKIISADFLDVVSGWFRAQYITVEASKDGIPIVVIYVTRNVDEEKRREENLIRISMTDEMTRLYNRRCYEEDLMEHREKGMHEDLVLFSVDVNGLKTVNDTKGHAAGDELIKGAADCLSLAVGNRGKVYRTGGDEFIAIVHIGNPEAIRKEISDKSADWRGIYSDKITMSVGYATHRDNPDATIDDLEHIADADMYAEKGRYYRENGIDRRK